VANNPVIEFVSYYEIRTTRQ